MLLCLITAYGVIIVAHGRSLFPDDLVGRGVTTVNLAQVIGGTLLPMATGVIVGAFAAPAGQAPEMRTAWRGRIPGRRARGRSRRLRPRA